MKRAAVILARGGSKRLPRKNIRPFHGKPIIHYPIAAALASRIFDQVFVSTDDPEIAEVARLGGCDERIVRPPELASDTATTTAAMHHAVETLVATGEYELEHVCCLYPCTPFISAADLHDGFDRLVASGKCYAFPVTNYEQAPQRMLRMEDDGRVMSVWPQFDSLRNQDLEPRWHDGGQWYWGTRDAWLKEVPIYGASSLGLTVPRWRAIDIDTYDDWLMAEAVFQAKFTNEGRRAA